MRTMLVMMESIQQRIVENGKRGKATTMPANSEFVALLKKANTDSSKMAEVIGVSEGKRSKREFGG